MDLCYVILLHLPPLTLLVGSLSDTLVEEDKKRLVGYSVQRTRYLFTTFLIPVMQLFFAPEKISLLGGLLL